MPVRDRGDDEFVGAGGALQRFQPLGDLVGVTDELRCQPVDHDRQLLVGQWGALVRIGIRDGAAAGPDRIHPVAVAGRQVFRGGGVVGNHDVGRHHNIGPCQRVRRDEGVSVSVDRIQRGRRSEVVAGHERQPQRAGRPGTASLAAAEDPRGQSGAFTGYRVHVEAVDLIGSGQHRHDVPELLGEVGCDGLGLLQDRHGRLHPAAAQQRAQVERRRDHHAVDFAPFARRFGLLRFRRARLRDAPLPGAAQAEVDAARMERVEHPETLDHRGGRGMTQLHGPRTDANRVGSGCDLPDQHRRCGAGDCREVMLGDPEPAITPPLGVLGQFDGVA
jgi:hypothetical protein